MTPRQQPPSFRSVGRSPRNGTPDSRCGEAPVYTAAVKSRFLFLLLLSAAMGAGAQIYRCTGAKGAITYQEIPCGAAEQSRTMDIPATFPEVNMAERNRLLQREAALEARQTERMRIESAERVALAELATREREAKLQREAAELAAQQSAGYPGYPVFITGPYHRGSRINPHPQHPIRRTTPPRRL